MSSNQDEENSDLNEAREEALTESEAPGQVLDPLAEPVGSRGTRGAVASEYDEEDARERLRTDGMRGFPRTKICGFPESKISMTNSKVLLRFATIQNSPTDQLSISQFDVSRSATSPAKGIVAPANCRPAMVGKSGCPSISPSQSGEAIRST